MTEPKHDILKDHLQRWKLENANTYDAFEKMMNEQSDTGYQQIMFTATSIFPKYQKLIEEKIQSKDSDDISNIEDFLAKEQLGKKFLEQINLNNDLVSLPAMLAWLYFGRSFENMVERGEELLENSQTKRFQKFAISKVIKLITKQSLKLGLRTEQDWVEYRNIKTAIKDNSVVDWALSEEGPMSKDEEKKTPIKKKDKITFDEMISLSDDDKSKLIFKINEYLQSDVKGKRVAFMIIALWQLGYLLQVTTDRELFNCIREKFKAGIGTDESIYRYLKDATAKQYQSEIDNLKTYFQLK